jgi:CDP-paratose 2-epimerase
MKILITGICGFVGSTLAKAWRAAEPSLSIYGIDNLIRPGSESNRVDLQKLGITLFHGDIRVASDFEILPAVDWVVDAAANPSVLAGTDGQTSSRQVVEHNLLGTINILEYCRKYRAGLILLSTSRVYSIRSLAEIPVKVHGDAFRLDDSVELPPGLSDNGINECFSTTPPISLYGSTKLASETLALEYGDIFGFLVYINRCGVLGGAGQFGRADQGIFSYWVNAYLRRRPLNYLGFGGKGYQVRDCLHPRDLLPLLQKQTQSEGSAAVKVFNIGGGVRNAMSLAELSNWCAARFGLHPVTSDPATRRFDIPWMVMDCARAGEVWGWCPEIGSQEILEEIASHAEQHPHWLELSGVT